MEIEIVYDFSLFLCSLPINGKVDKLFAINTFHLPSLLLVDGKFTESKGKFCPLTSFKDVLPEHVGECVDDVPPFVESEFDRGMSPAEIVVVLLACGPPIHLCPRHSYIVAGAFGA